MLFYLDNRILKQCLIVCLLAILLVACGGGSEDQIPQAAPRIQVSANVDISANEQSQIAVQGAATGGEGSLSFAWQVPNELSIQHPDTSIANATITTPVLTETTEFILTLLVTDSAGSSASDSFVLTVNPVNLAPVANISLNSIENYEQGEYPVNAQVLLDGSESSDEDAESSSPSITQFRWRQISGIALRGDIDFESVQLSFNTPVSNLRDELTFELEVTDQEGATASSQIQVTLLGQSGTLPTLEILPSNDGFSGERIALEAQADTEAPDARPLEYEWRVLSQLDGALLSSNTAASSFLTLPSVAQRTELTLEMSVTDSFGNRISEQVDIEVFPPVIDRINDTGVTQHATNITVGRAPSTDFAGQDADIGRDRIQESGILTKAGEGRNGFDFTKLNATGDPVDADAPIWSCVRDNITGVVWEIKTEEVGSLHASEQRFTWFASENNGNFEGELNQGSQDCNVSSQACNTQDFIQQVNQQGLCGFFDWRLPTHAELHSLVHYGMLTPPKADTTFFPFWGGALARPRNYWTSQSSADGVNEDSARNAWVINFDSGIDSFLNKGSLQYVRLVRAGRGVE